MIGKNISHFQINERLGEGGMGTVYKATDQRLNRTVAIKMLHPFLVNNPDSFRRFQNEAHLSARISHPNVATLYNFQEANGSHFIVMEYVNGKALDDILKLQGSLPEREAVKIIIQVLEGLGAAHELGIMHRDLKPGNIMITRRGYVKLMDFGIARLESAERMTRQNNVIGTLEYLSPELLKGAEPSLASDLYAVGVMLHEMLSGQMLFSGDSEASLIFQIAHKQPQIQLQGKDKRLIQIIKKLINKQPSKRYQSTQAVIQELEQIYSAGKVNTSLLEQKLEQKKSEPEKAISLPVKMAIPQVQLPKEKLEKLPVDWRILAGALALSLIIFIIGLNTSSNPQTEEQNREGSEMAAHSTDADTDLDNVSPLNALPDQANPKSEIEFIEKFDLDDETESNKGEQVQRTSPANKEKKTEERVQDTNKEEKASVSDRVNTAKESVKTFATNIKQKAEGKDKKAEDISSQDKQLPEKKEVSSVPEKQETEPEVFKIRVAPKSLSARFAQEVSTRSNSQGQTVFMYTTHEVEQQDHLIIQKGARIKGYIKELKPGQKGERASISIQLTAVQAANGSWLAVSYPPITEHAYKVARFKKDGDKYYKIRLKATNYVP